MIVANKISLRIMTVLKSYLSLRSNVLCPLALNVLGEIFSFSITSTNFDYYCCVQNKIIFKKKWLASIILTVCVRL